MVRLLYIFVLKFFVIHKKIALGYAEPLVRDHTIVADPDEFPFVVSIGWKKTKNMSDEEAHFCGGTLITPKHVLTAAHCADRVDNITKIRVKIGSNDLHRGKKYRIDAWDTFDDWMYQNYKEPEHWTGNDISIITLSKSVKIKPAYVSDIGIDEWVGKTAVTAGWGLKKNNEFTRFMEKADLNILRHEECEMNIAKTNTEKKVLKVPSRYLCTNAVPYVVLGCHDSGSPLIVNKNTIIAINRSTCPIGSKNVFEEQNLHVGSSCMYSTLSKKEEENHIATAAKFAFALGMQRLMLYDNDRGICEKTIHCAIVDYR